MVRLATPVVGASSAPDCAVARARLGCLPAVEAATVRAGCAARAADRAGAAATPGVTGADQPGRTEPPGRTAGRSTVERWITEGNWLRPVDGNWLRPADGSPPEPSADGIEVSAATPDGRCPTGWSTAAGGASPRAGVGPGES